MDAIALCYFGVNRKKIILQNSFKQIYVFKRDKAEIEKKPYSSIFHKMYCNNKPKRVI